jgi:uncharacterized membrane protein YagU involved in acid resistance
MFAVSFISGRPKALETILFGGLIAGALDGLDAVIYYGWASGVTPTRLFQHIASGLLGARAFSGGWATTLIGVACHFTIAIGAAAVFYAASLLIPFLAQRPWISGPAFGISVYVVMHYVVVPLSAVRAGTVPMRGLELIDQLFSHMFFVGLPIALMARRSART